MIIFDLHTDKMKNKGFIEKRQTLFFLLNFVFFCKKYFRKLLIYKKQKNMKKITLSILALSLSFSLFSQTNLKKKIAIVRPNYPKSTITFLKDFSKSLRKRGYTDASKLIDSYTKGGFGTGFLLKNEKGEFFIATNKHVVQSAEYVTVDFVEKKDTLRLEKCEVKAIDEQYDLALVKLPSEAKFDKFFRISTRKIMDGTDVFTAGYPGLGNKPSWQFGKGIVSNSEFFDKEITNDDNIYIQHTAQVDPGSSGGPLLVRSKDMPNVFEVVGVNTWKARRRESANFSLPSASVNKFLEENLDTELVLDKETLKKQIDDFFAAQSKGYKALVPYVSYSYISNLSVNGFYDLLNATPENVEKEVNKYFSNGMPIDGARVALASALYDRLKSKKIKFKKVISLEDKKQAKVEFEEDGKTIETVWVAEQGKWKLSDFSSLKTNKLGKNGIAKDFGYRHSLFVEADISLKKNAANYYFVSYQKTLRSFFVYAYSVGVATLKTVENRTIIDGANSRIVVEPVTLKSLAVQFSAGVQFPIRINPIYLIPNARILGGMDFGKDSFDTNSYFGLSAGMHLAYKIHTNSYFILGVDIKGGHAITKENKNILFGVNLGITF